MHPHKSRIAVVQHGACIFRRSIPLLKANFSSVRTSAMEDFIGRGDRRIGDVIRRAWQAGATNDSWWESEDSAFAAWSQAIEESGLGWKYREVSAESLSVWGWLGGRLGVRVRVRVGVFHINISTYSMLRTQGS
jgi:hypothetical protein